MGCPSEVIIGNRLPFSIVTHLPATSAAQDADSAPTFRVYEVLGAPPILTGTMTLLDASNTTGVYGASILASAANGFEDGKGYTIVIAATVGVTAGVSFEFIAYASRSTAGSTAASGDAGTDLENLQSRRSTVTAKLANMTATTGDGPTYSIEGQSVNRTAYRLSLYQELRELNELIALADGGVWEVETMGR